MKSDVTKRKFAATALCLVLPCSAFAATYNAGTLTFQTDTRQSVWKPGDAARVEGTYFAGTTWNETETVTASTGSKTSTFTSVVDEIAKVAWDASNLLAGAVGEDCGPVPTKLIETVTDTRVNFSASIATVGKAGVDLNYKVDPGSFDASIDFGATANLPNTVEAGQSFRIVTGSAFNGGSINNQSPVVEASVDAVLQFTKSVAATGCVGVFGCFSQQLQNISVNEDREIIDVTPSEATFLDGLTPDGSEIKIPLIDQFVEFEAGSINGVPTIYPKGNSIPKVAFTAGIPVGSVELTAPILNATGGKVGDSLVVNATTEFLDIFLDLDGTVFPGATLGVIPPGGGTVSAGPFTLAADAYDFDAGPTVGLFQDLKLTPGRLMVQLDMSEEVEVLVSRGVVFDGAAFFGDAWCSFSDEQRAAEILIRSNQVSRASCGAASLSGMQCQICGCSSRRRSIRPFSRLPS